jgi:hypothetical protein
MDGIGRTQCVAHMLTWTAYLWEKYETLMPAARFHTLYALHLHRTPARLSATFLRIWNPFD